MNFPQGNFAKVRSKMYDHFGPFTLDRCLTVNFRHEF